MAETKRASELLGAIQAATPDRLREVLTALCLEQRATFTATYQKLLVDESQQLDVGDSEDDASASEAELPPKRRFPMPEGPAPQLGNKRKRYEVCKQCDKEYDSLVNTKTSCIYHDGELEVDWEGDIWADHDERCHGTINTEAMRKEYPEGFLWSCCDRFGDKTGCRKGPHRPQEAKRRRY
ncbi:uncharacterized protein CC84DRAFT_1219992 [Paraphaeosphaeria sporulosa]|uniref:C2H2-type domain-containing protein n=1 Tax=Paraphaeosphaeria sporulosa TaxID=1460663 RepID=A0A177C6C9_9PLEO|nr:uncharacterized protein CC84DRAFT_1219992 [Paraphaeosphaeria sporulosa]OAG03085.1 hypothetical protein CC84DRAFT_1219992 [Paraphaeosphaeria sporulosa]